MKKLYSIFLLFAVCTANAQETPSRRAAAEQLLDKYISVSIDPYWGLTREEWDRRAEVFLAKADSAQNGEEFYYALRYFGALSNDGHFDFPDRGVYNRQGFFKKEDNLFPVLVKATRDDRVFVVRDFSGSIPDCAELLEVNGRDIGELSRLQHQLVPYEPNYAYAYLNEKIERGVKSWASFANYLFCEKIQGPFAVKYTVGGSVHAATIDPMERQALHRMSRSLRSSDVPFFQNVMAYNRHNDSIAVLKINHFWGNNPLTFLFSKSDTRFERLLRRNMRKVNRDHIKHLVLDIRSNSGGYAKNVFELMSYFAPDMVYDDRNSYKVSADARENDRGARILANALEMIHGAAEEEKRNQTVELYRSQPDSAVFRPDTILSTAYSHGETPKYAYDGEVYVLINSTAFSASLNFCNYFRASGAGLIAGTPSGGYSQVTGGARIPVRHRVTDVIPMKIPHILNNPLNEEGYRYILPDIPIEPALDDWTKGEDKSLEVLLKTIEDTKPRPEKE